MIGGNNNFLIDKQYNEFYSETQRAIKPISEKGKQSKAFKKRAHDQWEQHDFHNLAKVQDQFQPEDHIYGTVGRPNRRNYNRMEYDFNERTDGMSKEEIVKRAHAAQEITEIDPIKAFDTYGWTINTAPNAQSKDYTKPVGREDYEDFYFEDL